MWLMLQQDIPEDFVIATGQTSSVRSFITKAFAEVGISIAFEGQQSEETGHFASIDTDVYQSKVGTTPPRELLQRWQSGPLVGVDPMYFRPTEVDQLIGDATKAREKLGWVPHCSLDEMIREMIQSDMIICIKDRDLMSLGHIVIPKQSS